MKSKVLENKRIKQENLLKSALELFSMRDVHDVSIQEIVDNAGIAKGTFYLYFKDKYDIQDALIRKESVRIFTEAHDKFLEVEHENFEDSIIFLVNEVLKTLEDNPVILRFIKKNLSWGIFESQLYSVLEPGNLNIVDEFTEISKKSGYSFENPKIILYIILELVGSTCYNSIVLNHPMPIEEFKPHLFQSIHAILQQGKKTQ